MVSQAPQSTSARATCGRPSAPPSPSRLPSHPPPPPPAPPSSCAWTSSRSIGTPRSWSFATICSPRRRRAARVSRRNVCSRSLSGDRNSPRTCSSPQGARTLNSHPGMTRMPSFAASYVASATPSVVSWSVSANAARSAARAWCGTSDGAHSPSETVEWQCKSMCRVIDLGRGPGGLRLAEQVEQLAVGELAERALLRAGPDGREVGDAPAPLGPGAVFEDEAELIAAVHSHAAGGKHLPALALDGHDATCHGPPSPPPRPPARVGVAAGPPPPT